MYNNFSKHKVVPHNVSMDVLTMHVIYHMNIWFALICSNIEFGSQSLHVQNINYLCIRTQLIVLWVITEVLVGVHLKVMTLAEDQRVVLPAALQVLQ